MTKIYLETIIHAPIQIVFDAARNIDIHQQSAGQSNEKAIAGVTSGCIGLHQTVTWRGKHFGLYIKHQSKITKMDTPFHFTDQMQKGHFKSFCHHHFFTEKEGVTTMIDELTYKTPYGIFGKLFDVLLLKKHVHDFLLTRNKTLKKVAENQESLGY